MLKFPQSHHESDHACTLEELISHHNAPEDIQQYQCDKTVTCQHVQHYTVS